MDGRDLLGEAGGSRPARRRRLDHLLAVLVGAGDAPGLGALCAVPAHQRVDHHGGVGVADVRLGVRVVDRRGDVVGALHASASRSASSARSATSCGFALRCTSALRQAASVVPGLEARGRARRGPRRSRQTSAWSLASRDAEQLQHPGRRHGARAAELLGPVEQLGDALVRKGRRVAPRARASPRAPRGHRARARAGPRSRRAGSASGRSPRGRTGSRSPARSGCAGGGSSSVRSSAFCASRFSHSASAITAARRPPSTRAQVQRLLERADLRDAHARVVAAALDPEQVGVVAHVAVERSVLAGAVDRHGLLRLRAPAARRRPRRGARPRFAWQARARANHCAASRGASPGPANRYAEWMRSLARLRASDSRGPSRAAMAGQSSGEASSFPRPRADPRERGSLGGEYHGLRPRTRIR